ncbi:MAG: hypothetical protein QM690_19630 [Sphingobium sp.]
MGRSERNLHAGPHSLSGGGDGAHPAPRLPDWTLFARHRKPWTRLKMFHWPFAVTGTAIDNSVPQKLDQGIALFSRAMGPLLLAAALGGLAWGAAHWF